jgi:heat shock protein HslJ
VTLNRKITFTLLSVLTMLIFAACTPQTGPHPGSGASPAPGTQTPPATTPPGESPLVNTHWTLSSFGSADANNQLTPVMEGSNITLQFETGNQAGGTGGCNSYGATYQMQGNEISFSEVISTLMACADQGVMDQEQRFFDALQNTGAFELNGDQLKIWYNDGQGVLNFVQSQAVTPTATATTAPESTPTQPNEQITPTPQRIRFGSGDTATVVTGHLAASGSDLYVLEAQAGQTMTVDLSFTQGRAILVVWGADGTVLLTDHAEVSHFSRTLPSTQDYYIQVEGRPDGKTDYSMQVTIPPLSSPTPTPQRIRFGSGDTSATESGHLAASGSDLYVLEAQAGQTMTVDLSFTQGRAILVVWGADGTVLLTDHAEVSHFSRTLPSTQDYYIQVEGEPNGETNYSMQVSIPPTTSPTPTPQRIHFGSGDTSATESGHLAASGSDLYVLEAQAGQTMTVDLSFTQGRAILVVWGADGIVLLTDHAEVSHFSRTLPSTQDYYILVKGSRNNETDYSLQITIPPLS